MPVIRAVILLTVGLLWLSLALSQPATATHAPATPLIGYNDDFNVFEPHDTNKPSDIIPEIGLPFDPPTGLPLRGGGDPESDEPARASLIRTAKLGGAAVVRYVVPWLRVERERGSYDWTVEDETYQLVIDAGLKPVIVLTTSPCWAHPSVPCDYEKYRSIRPDPSLTKDFAQFAKVATKRYSKAAAFEVWNESNAKPYWGPDPSPRGYRRLLAAVWEKTRAVRPKPTILYNGLLPGGPWRRYLHRSYVQQKAGRVSTALALHPYVGDRDARSIRDRITKSRKLLRKANTSRAIWITEVGWSTHPEASGGVSFATQDRYVEGLERIVNKRRIKALIIHRLKDLDHSDAWEAGLGAITTSGAPKPLFCSLAARHGPAGRTPPPGC